MDSRSRLASAQLRRMRGMTRYYHHRFFSDIRMTILVVIGLLVLGFWQVPEAFLLVPVVALLGACATAFDASYLIFSRQYAARLETMLEPGAERRVLIGAELESTYLFPLDVPKIVTVPRRGPFSWFGFMTVLYTGVGAAAYAFGLALGIPTLADHGAPWVIAYTATLGAATLGALIAGTWWFAAGEGERRLRTVLDERFVQTDGA